ncbi:MAG TPA: hypothetical protein VGA04_25815 [Streptosporangiaceae bacterium]
MSTAHRIDVHQHFLPVRDAQALPDHGGDRITQQDSLLVAKNAIDTLTTCPHLHLADLVAGFGGGW